MNADTAMEILCVGDVHGAWDDVDRRFVEEGAQSLVVFVGDIGHNNLDIIRSIGSLRCPKFILLGNHDAWDEMLGRGSRTAGEAMRILGDAFGGYRSRLVYGGRFGVVGCRPFSWGGSWCDEHGAFYARHFGVADDEQSSSRIVEAAAAVGHVPLILVGHQGPAGLGDARDSIFGRDFALPHADFGDADFRSAFDTLRSRQRVVATVSGHMHEALMGGGHRVRSVVEDGTLHVNAAVVPRHQMREAGVVRHFVRLRVSTNGATAHDVWIDDRAGVAYDIPLPVPSESG